LRVECSGVRRRSPTLYKKGLGLRIEGLVLSALVSGIDRLPSAIRMEEEEEEEGERGERRDKCGGFWTGIKFLLAVCPQG
jgi:hypothetical protein